MPESVTSLFTLVTSFIIAEMIKKSIENKKNIKKHTN